MAHLIMVAFIFSGCNFFHPSCLIFGVFYIFPQLFENHSGSWICRVTFLMFRYWYLLALWFEGEVDNTFYLFLLFFSWNLKFVSDYQSICVSYCNCGFNDSNWSNNILVILTTVLVTVDAVQKYFVTSVD